MKVTNDKIENRQAFLTIEMDLAEVEASLEKSYHRLVKKISIPGFRKGKAPRAILESHIGKESLLENALNNLLPEACEQAIKEQKIEAFARPFIEINQVDPVIFTATVPLAPTIKLGDYHSIRIKPEPVKITKDDVNKVVEQLRHQHATWEPVERPVEFNDSLIIDVEGNIEGKGILDHKGAQYQVVPELPYPLPGFSEQLPGMSRDGEKEFKLTFPKDYPNAEAAGKEATFKVKIIEIKQEKLPELNDDFAKGINPEIETLEKLRESVSADLKLRAEEKARREFEEKVLDTAVDMTELEFPPILVEVETDRIISQQMRHWKMNEKGLEEYLSSVNKTEEELRKDLEPPATKKTARSLVLGKIADEEKIKISDAEIKAEIDNMTQSTTENKNELNEALNTPQARESIEQVLLARKTIQWLVDIAEASDTKTANKTKKKKKEEKNE